MMEALKVIIILSFMSFNTAEESRRRLKDPVPRTTTGPENSKDVVTVKCVEENKYCGHSPGSGYFDILYQGIFGIRDSGKFQHRFQRNRWKHTTPLFSDDELAEIRTKRIGVQVITPGPRPSTDAYFNIIPFDDTDRYCGRFQANIFFVGVWSERYLFPNATQILAEHTRRPYPPKKKKVPRIITGKPHWPR